MDRLRTALSFGGILPKESVDYVAGHFVQKDLRPPDHFHRLGSVAHEIGFLNTGILRVYSPGTDGEEITKYFVRQNQFAVNLESYYNLQPSDTAIQAVTETRLFVARRSVWDKLSEEVPKFYILTKCLTEAALLNKIKDNDFLNFGTAAGKYEEFIRRYPDLALQVPQQFIASYLKITPQSLSRIRKNIGKR